MPLEKVSRIANDARKNQYAVMAFNAFSLESIKWVIDTAESEDVPVILMLYPAHAKFIPFRVFADIVKELAKNARIPVGLHLDHSRSFDEIELAIRQGFSSVMFDGSDLPYDDNLSITRRVVEMAHQKNVDVEAELGFVGSAADAHVYSDRSKYTDPEDAVGFVRDTDVDLLAVSIGNAHGNYIREPQLEFPLLHELKARVGVPLVLHGGTGIPDDQIQEAIRNGISKINLASEYFQVVARTFDQMIAKHKGLGERLNMINLLDAVNQPLHEFIAARLKLVKPS